MRFASGPADLNRGISGLHRWGSVQTSHPTPDTIRDATDKVDNEAQAQHPVQDPIQHAVKASRRYIQQQRESHRSTGAADPPASQPKEIPPYCPYPATCRRQGSKCERGKHAQIMCGTSLERKSGATMPCNWYVKSELCLPGSLVKDDRFVLYARNEPKREIVIAPRAFGPDRAWKKHHTNREVVVMPLFWAAILSVRRELCDIVKSKRSDTEASSVRFFLCRNSFVNPTKEFPCRKDKHQLWKLGNGYVRATDCHAHAHLHISAPCASILSSLPEFGPLIGRTENVEDYRLHDCERLEQRILGYHLTNVEKRLDEMQKDVDKRLAAVQDDVHGLREDVKAFKTEILNSLPGLIAQALAIARNAEGN